MPYILCIETSTTNCSVALVKDEKTLVLREDYDTSYSHAERLHCFIDEVVKKAGITISQIDAVAVSKGPGSYTGLRIGVASAKGLCYALDVPLISIPTLELLAAQVANKDAFVVPMIDARRMEVYAAVFKDKQQIRETRAEILEDTSFAKYLEENKVHFIGNGVAKFKAVCNDKNAVFMENKLPSANEMAMFVYEKFQQEKFEGLSSFDPYYLKEFIAG